MTTIRTIGMACACECVKFDVKGAGKCRDFEPQLKSVLAKGIFLRGQHR